MTRDRADLTSSGHSGLRSSLSFHFRLEQRISLKGHKLNLRRSLLKRFWETTPLSYRQGQIKGSLVLQTFVGRDGLLIVCLQKISINHSRKPTYKNALLQSSIADYSHRIKTRLKRKMLNFCPYHLFNIRSKSIKFYKMFYSIPIHIFPNDISMFLSQVKQNCWSIRSFVVFANQAVVNNAFVFCKVPIKLIFCPG